MARPTTSRARARSATPGNWVAESSRRARSFTVYAALRELGRDGLAALVDRCCALARRMADGLRDAPGVTILNDVVLNQVLVRFAPPGGGSPERGRRLHPARDRRGPGRRDVLARRDDVARHGRDADLGLELVDDRGRRRRVRGGDPALRRGRRRGLVARGDARPGLSPSALGQVVRTSSSALQIRARRDLVGRQAMEPAADRRPRDATRRRSSAPPAAAAARRAGGAARATPPRAVARSPR